MKSSIVLENVVANYETITPQQKNLCTRQTDENSHAYYTVFSETKAHTTYTVRYSKEHGFTCTCPAGEHGFSNVGHPSGVCKHVRWAVASSIEERNAYQLPCEVVEVRPSTKGDHESFALKQNETITWVQTSKHGDLFCSCDIYFRSGHCQHTKAIEAFHHELAHELADWTRTVQ